MFAAFAISGYVIRSGQLILPQETCDYTVARVSEGSMRNSQGLLRPLVPTELMSISEFHFDDLRSGRFCHFPYACTYMVMRKYSNALDFERSDADIKPIT